MKTNHIISDAFKDVGSNTNMQESTNVTALRSTPRAKRFHQAHALNADDNQLSTLTLGFVGVSMANFNRRTSAEG
eukprot:6449262-Amphidinium_carterae.1